LSGICENSNEDILLRVCYSSGVTHVVSEHETVQQSIKALCREADDWPETTSVVTSSWLSECIKAGRLVDVQRQHYLPAGTTTAEV